MLSVTTALKVRPKSPPFANSLIAAKRKGARLNVFVHAGDHAWRRAKSRPEPHVLCCPPDADFTDFDWSCVAGLDLTLIVWNRTPDHVDAFAKHLVKAGASLVAAIVGGDGLHPLLTIYKPKAKQ